MKMSKCVLCLKRKAVAEVEGLPVCRKCATKGRRKGWKDFQRKWREAVERANETSTG